MERKLASAFVVITLLVSSPASADVNERIEAPQQDSSASILAALHAYRPQNAKSAYVAMTVMGEHLRLQNDPTAKSNSAYYESRMKDKWSESTAYVDGYTYRNGWTEALLKTGIQNLTTALTKSRGSSGELGNLAAEKILDLFATAPGRMPSDFDFIVNGNAILLANMQHDSVLGDIYRKTVDKYLTDVNVNQSIDNHPEIGAERSKNFVEGELKKLGFDINQLKKLAGRRDPISRSERASVDALKNTNQLLTQMLEGMKAQQDQRARVEALARARAEVMSVFGLERALARFAGNKEAALFIDRGASFVGQVIDTFNSELSFSKNPAAFANMYAAAGIAALDLFNNQTNPEFSALNHIMDQLRAIQRQIAELGVFVEKRFNLIDQTLQTFVHNATAHMEQLSTENVRREQAEAFFRESLNQLQSNTYGTYVLYSRLEWMRLKSKCFNPTSRRFIWFGRHTISTEEFEKCRNEIGLYAIVGPPAPNAETKQTGSIILQPLIRRLKEFLPLGSLPVDSQPDPAAWLMAMNTLNALADQYPEHKALLGEPVYDKDTGVTRDNIIRVGRFYQKLINEMAVDKSGQKPRLRTELLEGILNDYRASIYNALSHIDALPNKYLRNAPHPKIALDKQLPNQNINLYAFMKQPLVFCNKDSKIEQNLFSSVPGVGLDQGWFQAMAESADKLFKEHPEYYNLPPKFLDDVPNVVRFALMSAMTDASFNSLSVRPCFAKIAFRSDGGPGYRDQVDNLKIEVKLIATYLWKGQVKEVTVMALNMDRNFHSAMLGIFSDSGRAPMEHIWNGTVPAGRRDGSPVRLGPQMGVKQNWKDYFTYSYPGLADFATDFDTVLQENVDYPIMKELRGDFSFNESSRQAREQLAFVLERGIKNTDPAIAELLNWVTLPANLPDASVWALTQYSLGWNAEQAKGLLKQRLDVISDLIAKASAAKTISPETDLFKADLSSFETIHDHKNN